MKSWQLTVLGASSSITPPGESTAALHLGNNEKSILIDAGGNLPYLLRENEIDYRRITDVLISHSHPDHTYGFPFLSHCFYRDKREVTCRAPAETIPRLKKALEAFDLDRDDKYLQVDFQGLSTTDIEFLQLEAELKVKSVPTKHGRDGVGYLIRSQNQSLLYTADTAPNPRLKKAGQNVDVLIVDCQATEAFRRYFKDSHCSALEVGKLASELNVKTVVPFHYNTTEFPVSWQEIGEEVRENFAGTIVKPHGGMAFTL